MNQTDNMKNVSKSKKNNLQADVVIVGTGVGGCFSALNLSEDLSIIMITKSDLESSDSFLAQGGICVLHDDDDYDSYFEDTMRAGHYENFCKSYFSSFLYSICWCNRFHILENI